MNDDDVLGLGQLDLELFDDVEDVLGLGKLEVVDLVVVEVVTHFTSLVLVS